MTGIYVALALFAASMVMLVAAFVFQQAGKETPEAIFALSAVACFIASVLIGAGWFVLTLAEILAKAAA